MDYSKLKAFPDGFLWGASSSAYQCEGAYLEDGRTLCVSDTAPVPEGYTNFNDGQYLEFNGYHPFIDGRAELYLYKNNKEYDYFIEYSSLKAAGYYYREFVDKYEFNYFILNKSTDSYLYFSLLYDDEFDLVYTSYDVNLFVRNTSETD